MKKILLLLLVYQSIWSQNTIESEINTVLDNWHKAASEANFTNYFDAMANESIFIGTDATEHWDKKAFMAFAKPYFDKGKAWHFTKLERHIFYNKKLKIVWFDELLNTAMRICRGSGVLVKENGKWKIKHYTLSMTIPNENVDEVVKIKKVIENPLIEKLQANGK